MDLEFNIIGFGYTKSCSGINLLHFGTSLVYWASPWGLILNQSTVASFLSLKTEGLAVNKPTGVCVRGFVLLAPLFNLFLGEWSVDDEVEWEEERELGLLGVNLQHLVGQVAPHRNGLDAGAGLVNHLWNNQNNSLLSYLVKIWVA